MSQHEQVKFPATAGALDGALAELQRQGVRVLDYERRGEFWIVKFMRSSDGRDQK